MNCTMKKINFVWPTISYKDKSNVYQLRSNSQITYHCIIYIKIFLYTNSNLRQKVYFIIPTRENTFILYLKFYLDI